MKPTYPEDYEELKIGNDKVYAAYDGRFQYLLREGEKNYSGKLYDKDQKEELYSISFSKSLSLDKGDVLKMIHENMKQVVMGLSREGRKEMDSSDPELEID